jgi:hypothetical protein
MSCANVKDILEALAGSDLSSTARLVAVLEACGVTDRAEIERLTASKPSTVREARRALDFWRQDSSAGKAAPEIQRQKSSADGIPAPEIQHSAGNPAVALEIQRSEATDLACADMATHPSKESSSKIVILEGEVLSPLTPQADRQPDPVALYEAITALKPQRQPRQSRGSRLASEWILPAGWHDWAKTNCFASDEEITRQADTFRDFWISKPGAQACKLDWEATWRNWCRKAFSSAGRHQGIRQPQTTGRFNDKPSNAFHSLVNEVKMGAAAS